MTHGTKRLGVIGHTEYDRLDKALALMVAESAAHGYTLAYEADLHGHAPKGSAPLGHPSTIDALITLGGDGTLLRGARYLGGANVPIFGVNLGKLGFLTACAPEEIAEKFPAFLRGEYAVQDRLMIEASSYSPEGEMGVQVRALNDVVVHKAGHARVLRMKLYANDDLIAAFAADGVVIATPTGSTAYSLSADGPIVFPTLDAIVVTPVAPHTLALRSTIFPADTVLRVETEDYGDEVLVTADGQVGIGLAPGHTLTVRRSTRGAHLVRFAEGGFFTRLRTKLAWGGPPGDD